MADEGEAFLFTVGGVDDSHDGEDESADEEQGLGEVEDAGEKRAEDGDGFGHPGGEKGQDLDEDHGEDGDAPDDEERANPGWRGKRANLELGRGDERD